MNQFNPRIQLKNWFAQGQLKPDDPTKLLCFAKTFIGGEEVTSESSFIKNVSKEALRKKTGKSVKNEYFSKFF